MRSSIGRELGRLRAGVTCEGNCQGAESLVAQVDGNAACRRDGWEKNKKIVKDQRNSAGHRVRRFEPAHGGRACLSFIAWGLSLPLFLDLSYLRSRWLRDKLKLIGPPGGFRRFWPCGPPFPSIFWLHVLRPRHSVACNPRILAKNAGLTIGLCNDLQAFQKKGRRKVLYIILLVCKVGLPPLQRYSRMRVPLNSPGCPAVTPFVF